MSLLNIVFAHTLQLFDSSFIIRMDAKEKRKLCPLHFIFVRLRSKNIFLFTYHQNNLPPTYLDKI